MAREVLEKAASGAVGGFLATVPMTVTMIALHGLLPDRERRRLPPNLITRQVMRRVGRTPPDSPTLDVALTLAAHFAYGAAAGTLYRPWRAAWPKAGNAQAAVSFGLLVWLASYLGWIPATGILPPANRHPRTLTLLMLAAHIVWGGSTGAVADGVRGRRAF